MTRCAVATNIGVTRRALPFILTALLAGCATAPAASPTGDPLAGTYTGFGSATTLDQAMIVTTAFTKLHPTVTFKLNVTDTETSIVKVRNDDADVDFGFIGRELAPSEGALQTTLIGATGSAFAVNAANPVRALRKGQLADLLTAKVTDWSAVGGSGAVKVIVREPTSQTRSSLENYIFGTARPSYPTAVTTSAASSASTEMLDALTSFSGALGMVTIDSVTLTNKNIAVIAMDGVMPTQQNALNGSWPVRRALYLTTNADPTKVKPAIRAFIEFLKSPEGQKAIGGQ